MHLERLETNLMVSGSPPGSVFVDAGAKVYVCVCVLMVKASCCFCRFNVISFFFNYDNDYGHHRSRRMLHIVVTRLTDSNNVPQKNNLQVFRDIHVHSFLSYTIMSHPMNTNLSPYQQPHSLRKKTTKLQRPPPLGMACCRKVLCKASRNLPI